jgi:hypothetical protein
MKWLDERLENVYSKEPGYQDSATPLFMLDPPQPEPLPEDLVGERWAFVELPVSGALQEDGQTVHIRWHRPGRHLENSEQPEASAQHSNVQRCIH